MADITPRALNALKNSDVIAGYKTYLNLVMDVIGDKPVLSSGMGEERQRCEAALREAAKGKVVSIVSSGDPGVYGMAGLVLELADSMNQKVAVEIIPGVPASCAASALLGAPIMHDHAVISLSDLLTPWELIEKRVRLAVEGDYVIVLYNPKSSQRTWQIEKTRQIIMEKRPPTLPVGIVKDAGREGQEVIVTTLSEMLNFPIDMTTIIIVGNSTTFTSGSFMVTRRGYKL
ncbi:MAG: precorrin-3B C(17)-methyltransferase [Planctomycetes bacterium RIFCSPHIGHO2_02_FULL_50_42]|nr:MAG: precorrin-3B C(17)-methyltransferase [Planctomycetes bacterium RIFCSPHIGHO2_02_FULL_50_42]OHB96679.1 MAG: precorrin-3B C(17)-methyltransferase [Planctomycetes bacterium RIFCSPLOWO2_02_FULL_50_16]OHC02354.1 MAG: precorrin-3B C(17)-methyltransferase [Planctomycetes bacterium RIFCSPLOWO2_12_FULL_50_35]